MFQEKRKSLHNSNIYIDIVENVNDAGTCFVYLAAKIDDTSYYEVVAGSYESIKAKLESL